jgi:NAD(P)-dependent dehydrogenase (short-subunit alcohol dehydrogenase family)
MSAGVFADAATEEGAAALVRATPNADILVNNLGIYEVKEFNAVEFAERRGWHWGVTWTTRDQLPAPEIVKADAAHRP